MTNWVVVVAGLAIVSGAVLMFRHADATAAAQRKSAKLVPWGAAFEKRFTPGLHRLMAIGLGLIGVAWVVGGLFLGDKL